MNASHVTVRRADINDAETVSRLIHRLAEFENMGSRCDTDAMCIGQMMSEPFGLGAVIAECDGNAVGAAVYSFYRLATFSGRKVLYLEDLFIEEEFRHLGAGSMLFEELEKIGRELSCLKIEWKCLAWNENARAFYEKCGGSSDENWLTYTLDLR
ncbi:MAG: GNAT family N-acetyltransferase [Huintestinicola sp.]